MGVPEIPEPSQQERDAVSFWFRRLATTLTVANGAGVLAVTSFINGKNDLLVASVVAYPALTLFVTGAVLSATSIFLAMLYSALRISAYSELEEKRQLWAKKSRSKISTNYALIFGGGLLILVQMSVLSGGVLYFYLGSRITISAIGELACTKSPEMYFCKNTGTMLFPAEDLEGVDHSVYNVVVQPRDGEGRVKTSGATDVQISARSRESKLNIGSTREISIPTEIYIDVPGSELSEVSLQVLNIRLISDIQNQKNECWLPIGNAYVGSTSPILINPEVLKFITTASSGAGRYKDVVISVGDPEFTVKYSGKASGINFLALRADGLKELVIPAGAGESSALVNDNETLTIFLEGKNRDACRRVAADLGFRVMEY